jgi:16S rRNA (cytidine1402-2'-O)-methyltransferase
MKSDPVTEATDSSPRAGTGTLWLVSTPIGNLGDLSPRAARTLGEADLLVAEDTRHTAQLLGACGIRRVPGTVISLNEQNERDRTPGLVARLLAGESVALVSDAGTPLMSDPGAVLVAAAARAGVPVSAVPGCCAAVAALTLSALPTDRFCFEGFLPAKTAARRRRLETLRHEPRTLVFYEAPHRIQETLGDMALLLGEARPAAIARELTKKFETVYRGTLAGLAGRAARDEHLARGEIVLIVAGAEDGAGSADDAETDRLLGILLAELPASQAAKLAAQICGRGRRELFERAVALQGRGAPS